MVLPMTAKYGFSAAMGALSDSVGIILSRVERRVEASSQNISNASTPGYKRAVSFETVLAAQDARLGWTDVEVGSGARVGSKTAIDFSDGQLQTTGNPEDLAISGAGFFSVKSGDGALLYTRQGQFHRDENGRLMNAAGCALQQRGGGDLVLKSGEFKVLGDGTVMQSGEAVGRIAVIGMADTTAMAYAENGLYTAPDAMISSMDDPSVNQGALEASNVSLGAEMMSIMAALREAQSGQRLMNIYDDLMGRAVTTFGQG